MTCDYLRKFLNIRKEANEIIRALEKTIHENTGSKKSATRSFNIGNLRRTAQASKVKSGETTDIEGRLMDTESEKQSGKYQILENLSWTIMKQIQLEEKPFMSSLNICPET